MTKNYLVLILLFLMVSCNGDKDKLVNTYNEVEEIIKGSDGSKIYNCFDQKSKEYVDFLIDSTNNNNIKMRTYGERVGYPLFTSIYHKTFSKSMKSDKASLDKFILYLRLSRVPIFNAFQETKLVEDQTKVGEDNYVTVALEVGKNTFVTSRVLFTREGEEYKFNLLGLLTTSEKLYKQQYKRYVKNNNGNKLPKSKEVYKPGGKIDYSSDMFKSFLEEMNKPENGISSFTYKK